MAFAKILQEILKLDLMLQVMNKIDHCLKENIKNSNWINESLIKGKSHDKVCQIKSKDLWLFNR